MKILIAILRRRLFRSRLTPTIFSDAIAEGFRDIFRELGYRMPAEK